jgi:hypothetical protein
MGGSDAVMLSSETPSAYMHTFKVAILDPSTDPDGSSINMTLWSYCQDANLCILADQKVIPDGWVPFGYFVEELDKLVALIPTADTEEALSA